jgi:nucleotide-binding universal stress UspA family protein
MLSVQKILFPVDFSDRCRGAAHVVKALAWRFDAEVTPLHVIETDSESKQSRQKMEELVAAELGGCRTSPCIMTGDPSVRIVGLARAGDFDAILMPTHGHGPFRRFLLGAVTAKVLHDASCPVWTSAHLEDWPVIAEIALRNIACGIDFSPRSLVALKCALRLAEEFNAALTIVHAVPPFDTSTWSAEAGNQARRSATERAHKVEAKLGTLAPVEIVDGAAAYGLSEVAEQLNADLVVIGRSRVAAEFAKLGSNAYAIIAHSPCPVLSV